MNTPVSPSPEQAAVIAYPLLPLRVAAGAGTGKTTTMALRLAGLIHEHGIEPEAALGITFTNKAAEELADRLRLYLAEFSRLGREVEVTTYHGFAHGILAEFGPMVGFERDAQLITPGYVRELLRQALAGGDYHHFDVRIPRHRVDELALLAGRLGDHLADPAALLNAGPDEPDEIWATRREMAGALQRYREIKRRLNAVDFSDLIHLAHRVAGDPAIASRIRSRYEVVLLDEYQDTNPAQRELLLRLFGDGFPVTAVGDPDQTIYEWRGASLDNFADFPRHFADPDGSPATTLSLSVNHRCAQRIINVANAVRQQVGSPAGIERLVPDAQAGDGAVEISWFHNAVDEARWLAGEVRRLHDEDGIPWREIGVLFRKNRQIHLVREALQDEGIPVEVAALGGLLQVPEVADLHAWLRLIGRPDDAPSLVRILLGSKYRMGLGDLAPLADWVRRHRMERSQTDDAAPGWAMLEAVDLLEEVTGLPPDSIERLGQFRSLYRGMLAEAQGVTLVELCRRILERTGTWAEVEALEGAARLSARLNLYRFLDLAEEWSPLEGRPSLDAFLDYLDLLEEDTGSEELDTARLSNEDAVSLLTVHRAKGLEWTVVFVPAVAAGTFPSAAYGGLDDPTQYAKVLPFELRLDQEPLPATQDLEQLTAELTARHASQEWRTAYVAVTRAKQRFYMTGAFWYTTGRPKRPSPLYELVRDEAGTFVRYEEPEAGDPPPLLRVGDAEGAPDPHFTQGWQQALRSTLADPDWPARAAAGTETAFAAQQEQLQLVLDGLPAPLKADHNDQPLRVSVTGLVTYAACPKRYYWTDIDPLPRRPSWAARRGVEIHRRIELHNRGLIPLEDVDTDTYDVTATEGPTAEVGPDPFASFLHSRFAETVPLFTEIPFDLLIADRARLRGRIDAIYELAPRAWEIVDFKSGRPSKDPAAGVQLQAYALAAHEVGFAVEPPEDLRVTFAYLGDGLTEVTEQVDDPWLSSARARLEGIVEGILGEHWEPTASAACRSCDFSRFCPAGTTWLDG